MESGNLDGQQSEDLMRPPHAVRSKRKRGCSKDEADKGNLPKKLCTEGTSVKVSSDAISLAESSFINDLKKESSFADCGDLKTSTPNGAENLPQRRRTRASTSGVDTSVSLCLSPLDVSCASEKSLAEATSGDDKSLELSGVTDDSKPLERSSRRIKSTSARVLLGLEKRKEMAGQPKDRKERSTEVMMSVDRKPKGMTGPKTKKEVLPKVQHEVLSSSLEGLPDTPTSLSVERCTVVKPDWLKPFKLGWRREIVFRNTVKGPSSTKALSDVYYFSSDDTKLRSLPQILDYLKSVKSTLTAECFTFTKCAIYKEPQEMVRAAAFSRGRISRRTGLLSSNESSMKSFDDANEDASSQASSSTGTNRQRKVKESLLASYDPIKADVSVKTEPPVIDVAPEVTPETPIAPQINLDIKKEEPSPDAVVVAPVDETDKRQAVRAAATLALRTYMSHALRTVNNPLLQSGSVKPAPEKEKTIPSKSPTKTKTALSLQGKQRLPRKSLSPVVNIKRLNPNKASDVGKRCQPEENVRRRKGPPSAMNLAKLNVKRSDESYGKSQEPMMSKVAKLKARSLLSTAAATPKPGLAEKSIRDLRKMSPLKKSTPKLSDAVSSPSGAATSFEKINAAIKELMSKKDGQPPPSSSVKKLSKNCQQATTVTPLPVKALSKTKTLTTLPSPVVKILPKHDGKSNEKPVLSVDRRPAVAPTAVVLKPVERCLTETSRICGMDCPGRLGIPPTLPCATCMCLFHPECAGYTSHMYFTPEMNFNCWACGKLNKELETTSYGLYKRENQTVETSSSEAPSRNLKKQSAVGKSASNVGNLVDDVNAIALSSQRVQQASSDGTEAAAAAAAVAGLEHLNVLHPSTSLSAMFTEEVTVSCGPSAQLLVIPAALARHLNMSHSLILLVDDREVHVKPEQLKVSGVGLNITLPMGSVPDAFVEGPEKPLEFRVVSTAESGRQAVAVSLFERPTRKSRALEAFSTRKADLSAAQLVDSVGQSDSVIAASNESSTVTSAAATVSIKHGQDEGNLESSSGQTAESSAKAEGSLTTGNTTEDVDMKKDNDLDKSESNAAISNKANSGKMAVTENENIVPEIELSVARAADETPAEANLSSSSETGKDVMETSMEEPKAEVSMETEECSFPIHDPPIDSSTDKMDVPCERSEGEGSTDKKPPVACSTTDENDEGTKERDAAVVCSSSAVDCDESHEKIDGTDALEGNQLESDEPNDEKLESSIKTDV